MITSFSHLSYRG
ncbi:hypothetical protein F383_34466 [Gossypium arboreum]|uniref:Uncharacterized protein n=1 Tax=Gossypium arboreum TaxID=29729 RepID=A0A0B0PSC0_GOSAR|nr:hypothetical protein F383_34466 [Gossypium arboreum]